MSNYIDYMCPYCKFKFNLNYDSHCKCASQYNSISETFGLTHKCIWIFYKKYNKIKYDICITIFNHELNNFKNKISIFKSSDEDIEDFNKLYFELDCNINSNIFKNSKNFRMFIDTILTYC